MKLMQCTKKHYYDGDKFSVCPYCTGATGAHAYMGETMNETILNPIERNANGSYTPTEIVEDDEMYIATEIVEEEADSSDGIKK